MQACTVRYLDCKVREHSLFIFDKAQTSVGEIVYYVQEHQPSYGPVSVQDLGAQERLRDQDRHIMTPGVMSEK